MSVCQIEIQFDRENRTYHTGESISGVVKVRSEKDVTYPKFLLHAELREVGKGGLSKARQMVLKTFFNRETKWKKGSEYTYPFNFIAPRTPITYHGHHLSIEWFVRATVEVPFSWGRVFATQPSGEATFLLTSDTPLRLSHSSNDLHDPIRYSMYEKLRIMLDKLRRHLWLLFGFAPLIGCVVIIYINSTPVARNVIQSLVLLATIAVIFAVLVLLNDAPIWLAARQLGDVEMEFIALERNEGMVEFLQFTPKESGQIQKIEMILQIREIVEKHYASAQDTDNVKLYTHTVFKGRVSDTQSHRIHANELFQAKLALKSDSPLPASFSSKTNKIEWLVTMTIVLTRWAKWRKYIPIEATYSV